VDYLDLKDLFTGLALMAIVGVVGWLTGFFRFLWRHASRRLRPALGVRRNQHYGGWSTDATRDFEEAALRNKKIIVPTNVRTRWWVTNLAGRPVQVAEAFFLARSPGQKEHLRKSCLVSRVRETGELGPTTAIDGTQEIEVEAILFSDLLDDEQAIVGSFVLVDQTGKKYRTETLKHYRGRAERPEGWWPRAKARIRERFGRAA